MKIFAACCRPCTTEPMLKDGDGPMGKGRHHLISRCVPVSAHLIESVEDALLDGRCLVTSQPAFASVAPIPGQARPCHIGRNLCVGAHFGFLRLLGRSPAQLFHSLPLQEEFTSKAFLKTVVVLMDLLLPFQEPPSPR